MAKTSAVSTEAEYNRIMSELKAKRYSPLYFLMGEETYYIDLISDYIAKNVLTDDEKSFNQDVLYGKDVDMATVINSAKQYPMMADYRVVIVKEAQDINESQFEKLQQYLQHPQTSTLLVFCYKGKSLDTRKKYVSEIMKSGIVFEATPIKDYQIPDFIRGYMKQQRRPIDESSVELLANCLGNNLALIVSELDKLQILVEGQPVTTDVIEKNIGISKTYNVYALTDALAENNALQAYRIVRYAEQNPKDMPLQPVLSSLFAFFMNLLHFHYVKNCTEVEIIAEMHVQPFMLKKYRNAARFYNPYSVLEIIRLVREYDAKGKGFGCSSGNFSQGLLKELVGKILMKVPQS
ncbi:MAG: DNA polymerase III subunit delta [Bacteroidales bacterium]|nr:DNA polymerase III subunit delta [Bacteroidales bacterium]